jgi:hypothetical protein
LYINTCKVNVLVRNPDAQLQSKATKQANTRQINIPETSNNLNMNVKYSINHGFSFFGSVPRIIEIHSSSVINSSLFLSACCSYFIYFILFPIYDLPSSTPPTMPSLNYVHISFAPTVRRRCHVLAVNMRIVYLLKLLT